MTDSEITYRDSEIVIGLVGAVGTELNKVIEDLISTLNIYNYRSETIKISHDVIRKLYDCNCENLKENERISMFMDYGDKARQDSANHAILALGAAKVITSKRDKEAPKPRERTAYIIDSLKNPEEVESLRKIYSDGFYLIGVYSDESRRKKHLIDDLLIGEASANELIRRDKSESNKSGQQTSKTFEMSDFFVELNNNNDQLKSSIKRIVGLIFGNPYLTPTFSEFAMFMAFTSSLRSADLSRQVGAVIANDNDEIISMGANDCPKYHGGLYWPHYNDTKTEIVDDTNGRDYMRKYDSNKKELYGLAKNILKSLDLGEDRLDDILKSDIKNITEYGRVVHAEMESLLACARNNCSTRDATLYCTTFPCHNCAKHIIAAGIKKVVYIEPYPKSKAFKFHNESIIDGYLGENKNKVEFVPFVGIGPRKFFDLFSMTYGSGYKKIRKNSDGEIADWKPQNSYIRNPLIPFSYLDLEVSAVKYYDVFKGGLTNGNGNGKKADDKK